MANYKEYFLPRITGTIAALAMLDKETTITFDNWALKQIEPRYLGKDRDKPINLWLYMEADNDAHVDYISPELAEAFAASDFYSFTLAGITFNIYEDF